MGIKRSSVTGSAKEDFSEDLQLAWTRAHEEDGGGLSVKNSKGRYVCGHLILEECKLEITRR